MKGGKVDKTIAESVMNNTQTPFSNMAMSENEITSIMRDFVTKGATMRVRMITKTRMNKKGNPFWDDCYKDSTSLYVSGVSYENMINYRLIRKGLAPAFVAEKSSGMSHDDQHNLIMVSDKDPDKHYIDLKQYVDTVRQTTYIHADGRPYSEYELGVLQPFLQKSYSSNKQEIAGLEPHEQVLCLRPDVRNIISIKQGEEIIFAYQEEQQSLQWDWGKEKGRAQAFPFLFVGTQKRTWNDKLSAYMTHTDKMS